MRRSPPAHVGAHSITQVADVLRDRLCPSFAEAVLRDATSYSLDRLPHGMVDEREVCAVVEALIRRLGAPAARTVLREAGARTAAHIIANHIPRTTQLLMRVAPRRIALSMLLRAMTTHASTLVGSGNVHVAQVRGVSQLVVSDCTMCSSMLATQPMCDFYAGGFERLLSVLVAPEARVQEVECVAQGAPACRFELLCLPVQPKPSLLQRL